MEKGWKVYNLKKEWEQEGEPIDCYYPLKTKFDFICKKCGGKAILYGKNGGAYDFQSIIKCPKCGNEEELYGVDG